MKAMAGKPGIAMRKEPARADGDCGVDGVNSVAEGGKEARGYRPFAHQDQEPQTNGIAERFHKTVLDEFYRVAFRKKIYGSIAELQTNLDSTRRSCSATRTTFAGSTTPALTISTNCRFERHSLMVWDLFSRILGSDPTARLATAPSARTRDP